MIWKEKERIRIRTIQMDDLIGLLGIKWVDKVLNIWIRELYGVVVLMKAIWRDWRII